MDHYNEQLIQKQTEPRDIVKRVLIGLGTLIVIFICISATFIFGFFPLIVVAIGACYLSFLLLSGTFTEYEYIVTNNDLDIDRISGKRKRKRLITVKLDSVKQWGEYTGKEGSDDVNATVIASDATGYGAWYLIADHDKYGKLMVIFTPSEETALNINYGVPHGLRKKMKAAEEATEES